MKDPKEVWIEVYEETGSTTEADEAMAQAAQSLVLPDWLDS